MIVADVNVISYLLIEGRKTHSARELHASDPDWRVPTFWRAEFLNVLAMQVQHGGVDITDAEHTWHNAVAVFSAAETPVEEVTALRLAVRQRISAYDAHYVALAQQLGVLCASEDRELIRKFPRLVFPMAELLRW